MLLSYVEVFAISMAFLYLLVRGVVNKMHTYRIQKIKHD